MTEPVRKKKPSGSAVAISVVIPVRNCEASVGELCRALDEQTLTQEGFEVVFVDDGSDDRTPSILSRWAEVDPSRRRVIPSKKRGIAAARNTGFRSARADWIAFTDGDTLPSESWLENALTIAHENNLDALEGAVEAWPVEAEGVLARTVENTTGGGYQTANMMYRRSVLEALGGFDERLDQFLEDADLALRALDAGILIPFVPEVLVRHPVRSQTIADCFRSARRIRNVPLFAAKHPQRYRAYAAHAHIASLSTVDLRALIGLGAALLGIRTRGTMRMPLLLIALDGVRCSTSRRRFGVSAGQESFARYVVGLGLPLARACYLLEGYLYSRKRR